MEENRCVCCGGIIPEGRMLCPECESTGHPAKAITKVLKEYVEEEKNKTMIAKLYDAYDILFNVHKNPDSTKTDFEIAVEEAIGYLGEVLL